MTTLRSCDCGFETANSAFDYCPRCGERIVNNAIEECLEDWLDSSIHEHCYYKKRSPNVYYLYMPYKKRSYGNVSFGKLPDDWHIGNVWEDGEKVTISIVHSDKYFTPDQE